MLMDSPWSLTEPHVPQALQTLERRGGSGRTAADFFQFTSVHPYNIPNCAALPQQQQPFLASRFPHEQSSVIDALTSGHQQLRPSYENSRISLMAALTAGPFAANPLESMPGYLSTNNPIGPGPIRDRQQQLGSFGSNSKVNRNVGRRKSYKAPPGVWKNAGGYVSTIYVDKKRIYGPLRRTMEEAARDRERLIDAKNNKATEAQVRDMITAMRVSRSKPDSSPGNVNDNLYIGGTPSGESLFERPSTNRSLTTTAAVAAAASSLQQREEQSLDPTMLRGPLLGRSSDHHNNSNGRLGRFSNDDTSCNRILETRNTIDTADLFAAIPCPPLIESPFGNILHSSPPIDRSSASNNNNNWLTPPTSLDDTNFRTTQRSSSTTTWGTTISDDFCSHF